MSYATDPFSDDRPPDEELTEDSDVIMSRRMYLSEPGWRIAVKSDSHREFCYSMMPGQDFYHRLLEGEIFLHRHEEKLCLACASRRGLLLAARKRLREAIIAPPVDEESVPLEVGWYDFKRS
jgi:hypothetical protein